MATTCSRNDNQSEPLFSFFHALLEQKHAGCSSFIRFFSVIGTNTLADFCIHFGFWGVFSHSHFAFYSLDGISVLCS